MSQLASGRGRFSKQGEQPATQPADAELLRIVKKAVEELDLDWSAPKEPSKNSLDEWFLQSGRQTAAPQRLASFFPEVHDEISLSFNTPHSAWTHARRTSFLSSVNEADCWGYEKPQPLRMPLRPTSALQHPFKPCQTTANIIEKAFVAAGEVASALHTIAVLQVFQAKLLKMDKKAPAQEMFKELHSGIDLALWATKRTAQAVCHNMGSLVVLNCHL